MDYQLEDYINNIEPVGRLKLFTGKYRAYNSMSDFNEQIKDVDVYTLDQMIEFAKLAVILTTDSVVQEIDESQFEMEGHGLGSFPDGEQVIKEWFGDF